MKELDSYDKFDGVGPHSETIETRARIGERYLEAYESALSDPLLAGYMPADCPSELLLDLLVRLNTRLSPPVRGRVEELATLQKMLDGTPRYDGDDPRAVHYRRQACALKAAVAALSASSGRAAIIEECAKVVDELAEIAKSGSGQVGYSFVERIAQRIRVLTPAAPTLPEV